MVRKDKTTWDATSLSWSYYYFSSPWAQNSQIKKKSVSFPIEILHLLISFTMYLSRNLA